MLLKAAVNNQQQYVPATLSTSVTSWRSGASQPVASCSPALLLRAQDVRYSNCFDSVRLHGLHVRKLPGSYDDKHGLLFSDTLMMVPSYSLSFLGRHTATLHAGSLRCSTPHQHCSRLLREGSHSSACVLQCRCGDGSRAAWSPVLSFTTLQAAGPHAFPQRFALVGDLGQTHNSTATLRHLTNADPPVRLRQARQVSCRRSGAGNDLHLLMVYTSFSDMQMRALRSQQ